MAAGAGTDVVVLLVPVAAAAMLAAALVTFLALGYARRRGLLDQPGQRRSHVLPTPRGGGMGIVVSVLLVALPAWHALGGRPRFAEPLAVGAAALAVALIGWRDDHAALPVLPRLGVHLAAALLVTATVLATTPGVDPARWWLLPLLAVLLVGSINAHNFMDGIDGILGQQGLFVLAAYGLLALAAGHAGLAAFAFASAAGCLGFLWFNRPPARIFMGDVGSGTLGLLIAAAAVLVVQREPAMLWACLIVPSAFLVDSGLTLARRVAGRQHWYAPHRQHLYQWLVRVKWSHARTDVAYMTWNLLVVAPLAWLAWRWPGRGPVFALAAYAAGGLAWYAGKRACLATARRRAWREVA